MEGPRHDDSEGEEEEEEQEKEEREEAFQDEPVARSEGDEEGFPSQM